MENVVKMLVRTPERLKPRRDAENSNRQKDDFDKLLRDKKTLAERESETGGSQTIQKNPIKETQASEEQEASGEGKVLQKTYEPQKLLGQSADLNLLQMALPFQMPTFIQGTDIQDVDEAASGLEGTPGVIVREAGIQAGDQQREEVVQIMTEPEEKMEAAAVIPQEKEVQKEELAQIISAESSESGEEIGAVEMKPLQTSKREPKEQGTEAVFRAEANVQAGEPFRTAQTRQITSQTKQTDVGQWQKEQHVRLQTGEETLPKDLGDILGPGLLQKKGELTVELEPASLGKLTIKVVYEAGRAAVSIMAANPKTLEMLNQKAGELAGILEEKTGQTTVVYTQAPGQESGQYPAEQEGRGSGHGRSRERQQKREESENFAQQLRLGLV